MKCNMDRNEAHHSHGELGLGTRAGGHWRPMDTAMAGGTDPTVVPRAS